MLAILTEGDKVEDVANREQPHADAPFLEFPAGRNQSGLPYHMLCLQMGIMQTSSLGHVLKQVKRVHAHCARACKRLADPPDFGLFTLGQVNQGTLVVAQLDDILQEVVKVK